MGELIRLSTALPSSAELSEAEWAARDAAIAAELAAEEARRERCRQDLLRRDLAERGCPVKDLERVLSGELIETDALAAVRKAMGAGRPPGGGAAALTLLVLSGPPGVGKTTAAAWWLLQPQPPAQVVTFAPQFVDAALLLRWPRFNDARMNQLERASALVIDELGVEYDDEGGAFRSFLDGLVNFRYARCLPTLITTNLPWADPAPGGPPGFRSRYGERLRDRIREAGDFVSLRGASLRGTRA